MAPHNKHVLKKESGYALVIVLLVITVFSVLGLTVMSISFNHSKQFSKEKAQTQALNAAEMGLKAYDYEIKNILKRTDISSFDTFKNDFFRNMRDTLDSNPEVNSLSGSPRYQVQVLNKTVVGNAIRFTLKSVGTVQGDKELVTITQNKTLKYDNDSNDQSKICEPDGFMGVKVPCLDGIFFHHGATSKVGNIVINGKEKDENINFNLSKNDIPNSISFNGSKIISNTEYSKNVIISGSTTLNGNVSFHGNVYVSGSIAVINGNVNFDGYVYFKGSHSLNPFSGNQVIFNRTVFSNGSMSAVASNSLIEFKGGLVTGGSTSLVASGTGKIVIGGKDDIKSPITIVSSDTKYIP
ncbi:type II secretion system protein [Sporolactobacillus terrae]|uniref:Type 4 fimbrial biogenesis protein PilX N-terminal domain-containing protein n=1 Tax=Sporolactobacillus terrae TaxID=269673 RepID=A0ABX5Q8E1_9BACL|nr:type II secretion system protein [Sporolactobacillus terrae]QAA22886.1 hypothetical protein C0674_09765 [Sporolactobacillus terrae]QAA25859.1 hypothetical protein C0679_09745 [Sporolactobacillus terrae]